MSSRPLAATLSAVLGLALALTGPTALARADSPAPPPAPTRAAAPALPVIYAHRGASAYAPENTVDSIDEAARRGATWIENDVQRTKDGVLVVIHDETLARTTDVRQLFPDRSPWRVADFTSEEIALLDAGSWYHPRFKGARVPTLREFLARLDRHRLGLLMEIKNPRLYPGVEEQILGELDDAGWLGGSRLRTRLVIQSFDSDSVRTVHALRPEVATAFLGMPAVEDLPEFTAFADRINPPHVSITAEWMTAVHKLTGAHGRRMAVDAWTVDNATAARRVRDLGVDGIISNRPDTVRDALTTEPK
ncbi:glycerophosphodiester phosphodiesterase [Streptomyces sp. BI20]|uniref:glycerophosphodiester phosphodiesterase n=1 Tax=Streptomyces sp. BI20 TaxID=3403460 RepID=UPI003C7828A4